MGELRRPWYVKTDPETGQKVRRQSRVWWIRYYRNGGRYEESSGTTKKGEAERLLRLREGDSARAQIGRLRFEEAAAAVVTDYRVNGKKTVRDVEGRIRKHLEPFFGGRRMASSTTEHIQAFTEARQKAGASDAEINSELAVVKRAFRLARRFSRVLYVPYIPMPQENNVREGFFERDEFEEVREQLPGPLRPVVTCSYLTGWRCQSEILPLQWPQIDRNEKTIRLEPGTTKNKEGRSFPYPFVSELDDVIEEQWKEHCRLEADGMICPLVFHREGERIREFKDAWKRACIAAGVPEQIAKRLTGHKTRAVFDRYDIVTEADLRDAVAKLARATGKEKGRLGRSGRIRPFRKPVSD